MSRRTSIAAACAFVLLASAGPRVASAIPQYFEPWPTQFQTDVVRAARSYPGEFSLYAKDLASGTKYTYNAATPTYLASTVKIPVMIELFRQVEAGKVSLSEEIVYTANYVRDGSPLVTFLKVGTPVSLKLLLEAMIQQSDNAATDMVIDRVGLRSVNLGLAQENLLGFGPITSLLDVRHLVYGNLDTNGAKLTPHQVFTVQITKPFEARAAKLAEMLGRDPGAITSETLGRAFGTYYRSGKNSAPIASMGALLERLERGQIISPARSRQMLEVMMGTETGVRRMRAGLPKDVPLAHKTGTQFRRICDVGIFYLNPERPIVMATCTKYGGMKKSEELIAHLTRRLVWHLTPRRERHLLRGKNEVTRAEQATTADDEEELLNALVPGKSKRKVRRRRRRKKAAPAPSPPNASRQ